MGQQKQCSSSSGGGGGSKKTPLLPKLMFFLCVFLRFLPSLESMGRGARCGSDAAEAAVLPCFPLPLQRAALPGSKRTLNVMEPSCSVEIQPT